MVPSLCKVLGVASVRCVGSRAISEQKVSSLLGEWPLPPTSNCAPPLL